MLLLLTQAVEQDGVIDNLVVQPWVHRTNGVLVLATLGAAVVWLVRLARTGEPLDRTGRILIAVAEVFLAIQALLGIKLLDQGMGVVQLYIHYVGGLLPLAPFLIMSWFAWKDEARRTRVLALLSGLGLLSAAMAFFIGRAYVSGGLA